MKCTSVAIEFIIASFSRMKAYVAEVTSHRVELAANELKQKEHLFLLIPTAGPAVMELPFACRSMMKFDVTALA